MNDKLATVLISIALVGTLLSVWLLILQWAERGLNKRKCTHQWRSIAAPYGRQCRLCREVEFQNDLQGNFPDGFREYFDYIRDLHKERMLDNVTPRPQKTMDAATDPAPGDGGGPQRYAGGTLSAYSSEPGANRH